MLGSGEKVAYRSNDMVVASGRGDPRLLMIEKRLAMLQESASQLAQRTGRVADAVFGPEPQPTGTANGLSQPGDWTSRTLGALETTLETLQDISRNVQRMEREIE